MSSPKAKSEAKPNPLGIQRGDYTRTLAGPLLLGIGRAISIPLQHRVLSYHPLSRFGVPPPPADGTLHLPLLGTQPALYVVRYTIPDC